MTGEIVHHVVEHTVTVLREDLPADLRARAGVGGFEPGMLQLLPFISVSAETTGNRRAGLGDLVGVKRETIDGSPVDLGFATGYGGAATVTLGLWAITRPQLQQLHAAVSMLSWVNRERTWEAPEGTLNRTVFLQSHLEKRFPATPAPLPPAPPHLTVTANNVDLRDGPDGGANVVGQAQRDDQLELLGRSEDGDWLQGCCFDGAPVWVRANQAEPSIPLSFIPLATADGAGAVPDQAVSPGTAAPPGTVVWRQELRHTVYLEFTREPLVAAGELIDEVRITRQIAAGDVILDTERTRLFEDHIEVVDEFPD